MADWSNSISPWNIVKRLQEEDSRNEKIKIIETVPHDNFFWQGCFLALDQLTTFGVKKLPKWKNGATKVTNRNDDFIDLTRRLIERTLTGNAAKDEIETFMRSCSEDQWEYWFKRILAKRLACGADKTITDRAPDKWKARVWPWHGAEPLKNIKDEHLPTEAFVESKYDGERSFWIIRKGTPVTAFSRTGKEYHNFGNICEQLEVIKDFDGFPEEGLVLDGEVISKDFQSLAKQARRKSLSEFDGRLVLFDIIDAETFSSQGETSILKDRRELLSFVVELLKEHHREKCLIELSHALEGVNAQTQMDLIMDFFSQQVEGSLEGIIIKDANSQYMFKRHRSWIKHKPSDTFDLTIVGFEEGTGRNKGKLGSFICEGPHDGETLKAKVGSGISDKLREDVWDRRGDFIEQVIEVEADTPSRSKTGQLSLRFPIFKRFRDDK
jgi:hypothetical protein